MELYLSSGCQGEEHQDLPTPKHCCCRSTGTTAALGPGSMHSRSTGIPEQPTALAEAGQWQLFSCRSTSRARLSQELLCPGGPTLPAQGNAEVNPQEHISLPALAPLR